MDILKYGPDVEVLAPATLRARVEEAVGATLRRYHRGVRFGALLEEGRPVVRSPK
jgi:hypothetical protein